MRTLAKLIAVCCLVAGCGQQGTTVENQNQKSATLADFETANPNHKLFAPSQTPPGEVSPDGNGAAPSVARGVIGIYDYYSYWFRQLAEFAHARIANVNHIGRLAYDSGNSGFRSWRPSGGCRQWSVYLWVSGASLLFGPRQGVSIERVADNYYFKTTCNTSGGYQQCQLYFALQDTVGQAQQLYSRAEVSSCDGSTTPASTGPWVNLTSDLSQLNAPTYKLQALQNQTEAYSVELINYAPLTPQPPPSQPAPQACASGGVRSNGTCYYIGNLNQSCTSVCQARGGVHSDTVNRIGSAGTLAACSQVAALFGYTSYAGQPPTNSEADGSANGSGCAARSNGTYVYDRAFNTQYYTTDSLSRRFCGCNL